MTFYRNISLLFFYTIVLLFTACEQPGAPLPRGYFRIELPEKEYRAFDTIFPYSFSYPVYARVIPDTRPGAEPYWADIYFPRFRAVIHLSYKTINKEDQLFEYIEDDRNFINRHIPKATGFNENM